MTDVQPGDAKSAAAVPAPAAPTTRIATLLAGLITPEGSGGGACWCGRPRQPC
jgi:hypothetical protein